MAVVPSSLRKLLYGIFHFGGRTERIESEKLSIRRNLTNKNKSRMREHSVLDKSTRNVLLQIFQTKDTTLQSIKMEVMMIANSFYKMSDKTSIT
jgi:hypothetical protein